MDLHSEISYELTSFDFKYLTCVGGEEESSYKNYEEFREEIEYKLGKGYLRYNFKYLLSDDHEAYQNVNKDELIELQEQNRLDLSNLLKDFYPILRCDGGNESTSAIIEELVIPYMRDGYTALRVVVRRNPIQLSPYSFFLKEQGPLVISEYPNLSSSERLKIVIKMWSELPPHKRQKYVKMSAENK